MKRKLMIAAMALVFVGVMIRHGATQRANKVDLFMRAKLVQAQQAMEGLVLEDLQLVAKSAQEMSLLSQDASWQVLQTTEYMRRSEEFRRSADALKEAARQKNLDGATLAYIDVTLKCVECHKFVRTTKPK